MANTKSILVQGVEIHLVSKNDEDYISLTDMVQGFDGTDQLIKNWLQNKNTIDFLGVWERLNNPNFNLVEFHQIKTDSGLNRFVMSVKTWVQRTSGIGLIAKAGRYGGTFAHKDIAFEFGSWLSPEFKLYLIKEFQRLKEQEVQTNQLEWNVRRLLTKANYRIHTDAIKAHLIPPDLSKDKESFLYASEADLLNKALFGMTAKEWRSMHPEKDGNIRDDATVEQLVVLASLESQNALLIQQGCSQSDRLVTLNKLAINQMQSLLNNPSVNKLDNLPLIDK
jgi:hypothetical protein